MNKKNILASLSKISNTLDKVSLFEEATLITKVMVKIAQAQEITDYDSLINYKPERKEQDALESSIEMIRSQAVAIAKEMKENWIFWKRYSDEELERQFYRMHRSLEQFKEKGVGFWKQNRPATDEDLEILDAEIHKLKNIIISRINELKSATPTTYFQTQIPKEEIEQTLQENNQKLQENPMDFKASHMVDLCQKLLSSRYFTSQTGLAIAQQKFKLKNPYWDPRD